MDKRYQVFVSSTYADLKEERSKVIQALMEMDCIPAGMELFPAADEEQWEFIKRVINDCDYYILIIGGRYGSLTPEGISYTEKEYDYAMSIGLNVLAFIHELPDEIPVGKSDIDPVLRKKLDDFRNRVSESRLVKFWKSAAELPGLVALSLQKTIKIYPAVGWVRADKVLSESAALETLGLTKKIEEMENELSRLRKNFSADLDNLAQGDDPVTLKYIVHLRNRFDVQHPINSEARLETTWNKLYSYLAPHLETGLPEGTLKNVLARFATEDRLPPDLLRSHFNYELFSARIATESFNTIKVQFVALGFIESFREQAGDKSRISWRLSASGLDHMYKTVAMRRTPAPVVASSTV
jgi:hypothetical protein